MFKIISCGWQCAQFIEQTLQSVYDQVNDDWQMAIIYDLSDDNGEEVITKFCDSHPARWTGRFNEQQNFAAHNQWEALQMLNVDDDDIVIWLDLDGDRLAHPHVLDILATYYQDDTLLTYGSYEAVVSTEPPRILPIPDDVVKSNTYREDARFNGIRCNHLRTMKGKVAKAIPESLFQWPDGSWYISGQDYIFMLAGLELAGGRYKVVRDILHIYNDANPLADNKVHGQETHQCDLDFMSKPPLMRMS